MEKIPLMVDEEEASNDTMAISTGRRRVEMEWDEMEGAMAKRFVS